MTPRPLTFPEQCARLHAERPHLTHREVCQELAAKRRRKAVFGVLHVSNTDRASFVAVESPRVFAWQERADLA